MRRLRSAPTRAAWSITCWQPCCPTDEGVMDFDLTEEQTAFQETARAFAQERLLPHAAQWDEERHFPAEALREAAALGFAGIYVDEAHGGTGLSRLDAALIFEELAAAD